MKKINLITMALGVVAGVFLFTSVSNADIKQIKAYKEAYPGAAVKCINCHVDAMPKKDDGKHENNAYGNAVKEEAKKEAVASAAKEEVLPTVETYKKVGKIEDFKK